MTTAKTTIILVTKPEDTKRMQPQEAESRYHSFKRKSRKSIKVDKPESGASGAP